MAASDPWGQRLTTSAETATAYDDLLGAWLRLEPAVPDALRRVIDLDPEFALAHAVGVVLGTGGWPGISPEEHLAALAATPEPGTERERSFVAAAVLGGERGVWESLPRWRRHADAWPGDVPALTVLNMVLCWSTDRESVREAEDRLWEARVAVGDDPTLLAALAMHAQDRGDLDTAWELGQRGLRLAPASAVSAHPVAHVHLESGDHADGLGWLDPFVAAQDPESVMAGHLGWHCALHLLELDRGPEALARYTELAVRERQRLLDGSSLLWRCQLAGLCPPGTDPAGPEGATAVVEALGDEPELPFTFLGMHLLLAHADRADAPALRRLARRTARWSAPGAAELLPGLALALAAVVEDDPAAAAGELLALEHGFPRYGGSHAQREVLEDTLIRALVGAGRVEEAAERLRARLDRRPSGRDAALLGSVTGPRVPQRAL
jgi:hypothetical protein